MEAVGRLRAPVAVESGLMLAVATAGLAVNIAGLVILRGGRRGTSLNLRGAWLHVLTDALGSVQAIAAAVAIAMFGWSWIDPAASILIALLVVYASWSLLRESIGVLMEGVPAGIDLEQVRATLSGVSGVRDVHDLHVWSITSGFVALSAHLVIEDAAGAAAALRGSPGLPRRALRHSPQRPCRSTSARAAARWITPDQRLRQSRSWASRTSGRAAPARPGSARRCRPSG